MVQKVFDDLPKRVLGELEEWLEDYDFKLKEYGFDFDQPTMGYSIVKDAARLIKCRVPEEPKKIRPGRYVKSVGQCPACGRLVDSSANYCKRCGKALAWKEEER